MKLDRTENHTELLGGQAELLGSQAEIIGVLKVNLKVPQSFGIQTACHLFCNTTQCISAFLCCPVSSSAPGTDLTMYDIRVIVFGFVRWQRGYCFSCRTTTVVRKFKTTPRCGWVDLGTIKLRLRILSPYPLGASERQAGGAKRVGLESTTLKTWISRVATFGLEPLAKFVRQSGTGQA